MPLSFWVEVFLICLFVQVWLETPDVHICCFVIIALRKQEIRDWLPRWWTCNVVTSPSWLSLITPEPEAGDHGPGLCHAAMAQSSSQSWASHHQSQAGPGPCHSSEVNTPTISTMSNNSSDLLIRTIMMRECESDLFEKQRYHRYSLFYSKIYFILCFGFPKCKFLLVFLFSDEAIIK